MERAQRIGAIIKLIGRNPGITLSRLRDQLEKTGINITERTLAKEVLFLKTDLRLLPEKERLRNGYLLEDMVTLSGEELAIVLDAMHAFGERLNDVAASSLLKRLTACSGGNVTRSRTLGHRDIYKAGAKAGVEELLLLSIRERLPVSYKYKSPRMNRELSFKGYPLLLVFHERGWYCIIKELETGEYSPRRLDRIKSPALLKSEPNPEHHDNLKEAQYLLGCGWGMSFPRSMQELKEADKNPEIVARFTGQAGLYLLESEDRHPRAKVTRARDGTGEVEMRIRLSNPTEFTFWVRSFGANAWIVSPESLVEKERTEIRRMAGRYGIL